MGYSGIGWGYATLGVFGVNVGDTLLGHLDIMHWSNANVEFGWDIVESDGGTQH